jgi:hypothetical protein
MKHLSPVILPMSAPQLAACLAVGAEFAGVQEFLEGVLAQRTEL